VSELSEKEQRLSELLDSTLRRLPSRRAPPELESRVLREVERRAAQPWWRQTFAHWPPAARAAFVVICSALVGLVFLGSNWTATTVQSLHGSAALSLSSLHQALAIMTAAGELAALLANAMPPAWLYVGLAAGSVLYAVLFGLGAAAYRTLYLTPLNGK
jgi:hypothetical protein